MCFYRFQTNFSTNNTQLPLWNGFAFRHADLNDCSLENWEILLQIVKKLQNRPSDHDIAFGNEVAWGTLDHQTPRYGTQRVCLIVPKSFVTRLKSPSQTWFVPEKILTKYEANPHQRRKSKPKVEISQKYFYLTCINTIPRSGMNLVFIGALFTTRLHDLVDLRRNVLFFASLFIFTYFTRNQWFSS